MTGRRGAIKSNQRPVVGGRWSEEIVNFDMDPTPEEPLNNPARSLESYK